MATENTIGSIVIEEDELEHFPGAKIEFRFTNHGEEYVEILATEQAIRQDQILNGARN